MACEIEFRDVIHHYHNCFFICSYEDYTYIDTLHIVVHIDGTNKTEIWGYFVEGEDLERIQLLLRNTWDMSPEEKATYHGLCIRYKSKFFDTPESIHWLTQNSFDIFNLTERGYAMPPTCRFTKVRKKLKLIKEAALFSSENNAAF